MLLQQLQNELRIFGCHAEMQVSHEVFANGGVVDSSIISFGSPYLKLHGVRRYFALLGTADKKGEMQLMLAWIGNGQFSWINIGEKNAGGKEVRLPGPQPVKAGFQAADNVFHRAYTLAPVLPAFR